MSKFLNTLEKLPNKFNQVESSSTLLITVIFNKKADKCW